jgi:hypothetical protein
MFNSIFIIFFIDCKSKSILLGKEPKGSKAGLCTAEASFARRLSTPFGGLSPCVLSPKLSLKYCKKHYSIFYYVLEFIQNIHICYSDIEDIKDADTCIKSLKNIIVNRLKEYQINERPFHCIMDKTNRMDSRVYERRKTKTSSIKKRKMTIIKFINSKNIEIK